jgi:hypothetical protein
MRTNYCASVCKLRQHGLVAIAAALVVLASSHRLLAQGRLQQAFQALALANQANNNNNQSGAAQQAQVGVGNQIAGTNPRNLSVNFVGGISINADGILNNVDVDALGNLSQMRKQAMQKLPAELAKAAGLRKVSLRHLEAAIAECRKANKKLPDDVCFLGGLQQIRYVLVYPEQKDIVLVGPGDGWKVDDRGNVVGVANGRPIMLLDDLVVALRSAQQSQQSDITCSIDPTSEGLQKLRDYVSTLRTIGDPKTTSANIEQTLGMQQITFSGVPTTSHFARVLVTADYRMKRLAMGFEKPPAHIRGLPSFLQMMSAGPRGMSASLPRWWLEPKYDALLRDAAGLSWELQGGSVKALTEEDFLTANGSKEHTGKASPVAQKWADNMTAKYDDLSVAMPIFGDLRNCMELAIVGTLIVKENLPAKSGCSLTVLTDPKQFVVQANIAPTQLSSKASLLKKGHNWLISASGGVAIHAWTTIDQAQRSDAAGAAVRAKATPDSATNWCWN